MTSIPPVTQILSDEPKWSSASLCITLNHLGQRFRPEYTHQVIDGECWRGYRPRDSVLQSAVAEYQRTEGVQSKHTTLSALTSRAVLHKSHENHSKATNQLQVQVKISPSCQKCFVDVNIRCASSWGEVNRNICGVEPDAKRRRASLSCDPLLQRIDSSSRDTTRQVNEESNSHSPLPCGAITGFLSKALPPIASGDNITNQVDNEFLSEPIGDLLEEYLVPASGKTFSSLSGNDEKPSSKHFVLTIADGRLSHVSAYHQSVQKLALFFIENADTVDVANGDGGFWKIMYIFQRHDGTGDENNEEKSKFRYSLVGYFTLFHFIALFHKPNPGVILRICQALILPPFQGQGHGRRLLQNVYNMAHQSNGRTSLCNQETDDHDIVQVNVEDPAPAFVALRNKMDLKLVLENFKEWDWPGKESIWSSPNSKALMSRDDLEMFFSGMTEEEASEMSIKAKITPKQIHVANELLKLKAVRAVSEQQLEMNPSEKDTIDRLFRLMVKRRLNKEHREDLMELPTKDDQKAMLAELFEEELKRYERILS